MPRWGVLRQSRQALTWMAAHVCAPCGGKRVARPLHPGPRQSHQQPEGEAAKAAEEVKQARRPGLVAVGAPLCGGPALAAAAAAPLHGCAALAAAAAGVAGAACRGHMGRVNVSV